MLRERERVPGSCREREKGQEGRERVKEGQRE